MFPGLLMCEAASSTPFVSDPLRPLRNLEIGKWRVGHAGAQNTKHLYSSSHPHPQSPQSPQPPQPPHHHEHRSQYELSDEETVNVEGRTVAEANAEQAQNPIGVVVNATLGGNGKGWQYKLQDMYKGESFFTGWNFYSDE